MFKNGATKNNRWFILLTLDMPYAKIFTTNLEHNESDGDTWFIWMLNGEIHQSSRSMDLNGDAVWKQDRYNHMANIIYIKHQCEAYQLVQWSVKLLINNQRIAIILNNYNLQSNIKDGPFCTTR